MVTASAANRCPRPEFKGGQVDTAEAPGARNPIEASQPYRRLPTGDGERCGAKLRGKNAVCKRRPLKGRKRCRLHGGNTPAGVASPHFRHGRRSKYLRDLPKKLTDYCTAASEDQDLLSLR